MNLLTPLITPLSRDMSFNRKKKKKKKNRERVGVGEGPTGPISCVLCVFTLSNFLIHGDLS